MAEAKRFVIEGSGKTSAAIWYDKSRKHVCIAARDPSLRVACRFSASVMRKEVLPAMKALTPPAKGKKSATKRD